MRCLVVAICVCAVWCCAQENGPEEKKPVIDKMEVQRGHALFVERCGFCHGNDARGNRAPDLVRSPTVMRDEKGELIGPVIRNGRPDKGMPAFPLPDPDVAAITAFLHSQIQEALESSGVPANYAIERLLTGNAAEGKRYFEAQCASCHSVTGDLAGVASKYNPIELEASFLYPEDHKGRRATVTTADGATVQGRLVHLDDFIIALRDDHGVYHSFQRRLVRAEVVDPLARHREMLFHYTDADMRNIFAYLATLKGGH